MKRNTWLLILAAIGIAMWILIPNLPGAKKKEDASALSRQYCTRCHEYPDPSLLERDIWVNRVLPEMGLRLGIGDKNALLTRLTFKQYNQLIALHLYPDTPQIPIHDWLAIVAYYRDHSPTKRPEQAAKEPVTHGGDLFTQIRIPADTGETGQATLAHFMPDRGEVWLSSRLNYIQTLGTDGVKRTRFRTPSPVVDLIDQKEPILLGIGNMLPNEDRNGRLFSMDDKGGHAKLLQDSLHRPVQILRTDINKDGKQDIIVAEFGFETGQVRIIDGRSGKSSLMSSQPGARNIIQRDVDKDGLPDFYILFAQAREQVSLFHNEGGGRFIEKVQLRFPPVHGSSYLDMADMNGDGLEDMILTNGDNADYSLSYKPYHGVRIYLNDGRGGYTEKWFYPSYGATKTIAGDFDGDGDQDMAMIAFFAEPGKNGSFLYFENLGGMHFKPWDMKVPDGLWLVMESGDMDKDGDLDLVLGNFQFGPDSIARPLRDVQALILKNMIRH